MDSWAEYRAYSKRCLVNFLKKTITKQAYIPSMSGSFKWYAHAAVTQLKSQGALYPDAQMFFNGSICQEEPDVIAAIMTQLSLEAGLKQWGRRSS